MTPEFDYKEEWRLRGPDFSVKISRHNVAPDDYRGRNRWAVYAYIYPHHRLFNQISEDSSIYDVPELPLHGGCTFFAVHRAGGARAKQPGAVVGPNGITSYEIGCDYDHLGDERFTFMRTAEDAAAVFADARDLYKALTAPPPTEPETRH